MTKHNNMNSNSRLFSPMKIGQHALSHRIVMAPLTRFRAQDSSHIPLPFVKDYYIQRASTPGTLIITEGTLVSARAGGWTNAPGIWSHDQISAWKEIVKAVHEAGCVIIMQLFGLGRTAQADVLEREGEWKTAKGPSAIAIDPQDNAKVHEMDEKEIQALVTDFAQAAKNAIEGAGFDGVEVHGANGYLIDQFTQDTANQRTDGWGGSIEKRAKFALEVTKAVVQSVGPEKVGFRISPWSRFQGMRMKDVIPQFTYLVSELRATKLAYLHLVTSRVSGSTDVEGGESLDPFIKVWADTSPILIAGGFDPDSAKRSTDEQYRDHDVAIVFGRNFIATPDLVYRIRHNIPLNPVDRKLFYTPKQKDGYIDYAFSEEFLAEQKSSLASY